MNAGRAITEALHAQKYRDLKALWNEVGTERLLAALRKIRTERLSALLKEVE